MDKMGRVGSSLSAPFFFPLSIYIYVKLRLLPSVSLFSFFLLAILRAVAPNPEQEKTSKANQEREKHTQKTQFFSNPFCSASSSSYIDREKTENTTILAAKIHSFLSVFHVNWLLNLRSLYLLKRVFQIGSVAGGKRQVVTGLISILEVSEC